MRRIQAPGIELNEFDRSQYNVSNSVLEDAPVCFIGGFSAKGDNYSLKFINNKQTLIQTFGTPETEFEKYFYNGCIDIISNGGICLATRFPYDNESLDKYTYCDYVISQNAEPIGDMLDVAEYVQTLDEVKLAIIDLINTQTVFENDSKRLIDTYKLDTVNSIIACLNDMKHLCENAVSISFEDIDEVKDIQKNVKKLITLTLEQNNKDLCHLKLIDSNLTSFVRLSADTTSSGSGKLTLKQYDDLKIGNMSAILNKMRIVDISRSNYEKASYPTVSSVLSDDCETKVVETNDCLGIVPVVVSPLNALYFQQQLNLVDKYSQYFNFDEIIDGSTYSQVAEISTVNSSFIDKSLSVDLNKLQTQECLVIPLSSASSSQQSVSRVTALQFPNIIFKDSEHLDTTYLKYIGIVVLKAYKDNANSGQVNFQLLESFVGSLDKNAKDENTKANMYIDKIVNSNSKYINVFTNVAKQTIEQASILAIQASRAYSLGFYEIDLQKNITLQNSILNPISKILQKMENPNEIPLDILVDAGMSNIAQYITSKELSYNPRNFVWQLNSENDARVWQIVIKKFDDFCKYTRRDCMFIADGLKPFCLINNSKIVRDTDPSSSVQNSILPKLKYMANINSSYSAGYCNWFLALDEYSGDTFWCPPSIKVVTSYIYCDTYCHPWSVPAGMSRGKIGGVVDVAFQPNIEEAGKIYSQTWNYAVSYPADGIIIEGQKTFQKAYTALDRVNVRRLMLYLEKQTIQLARHFLYEGNTAYLRQQFIDAITPIFDDAENNGGIIEYAIKCDEELNTPQVIDNNEMRCKIAIKPTKALEFLVLDFIVTNQTANVDEEVRQ